MNNRSEAKEVQAPVLEAPEVDKTICATIGEQIEYMKDEIISIEGMKKIAIGAISEELINNGIAMSKSILSSLKSLQFKYDYRPDHYVACMSKETYREFITFLDEKGKKHD